MVRNDCLEVSIEAVDITPPLGSRFVGHLNRDKPAKGILDPLYGRLLYLRDREEQVLLVNCDLLEFGLEEALHLTNSLHKATHIPLQSILLTATHTHTGPATLSFSRQPADAPYLETLENKLCHKAATLVQRAQPCEVFVQRTKVWISCNRRKRLGDKIVMAPNLEGPVDPDLTLVLFAPPRSKPIGGILHYSMHPTTLDVHSYLISADYPGRLLQKVKDLGCFLFLQGACGDIKPAVFDQEGGFKEGTEDDIEHLGQALSKGVRELIHGLETGRNALGPKVEKPNVRLRAKPFEFIFHPLPNLEELSKEITHLEQTLSYSPTGSTENLIAKMHIDPLKQAKVFHTWATHLKKAISDPHQKPLPRGLNRQLVALGIGNQIGFLFIPGELFCSTGLQIKASSPFLYTCVTCYADGTVGYIPTEQSLAEGGYEAKEAFKYYGYPAPFHPKTEATLIDSCQELLLSVHPSAYTESRGRPV